MRLATNEAYCNSKSRLLSDGLARRNKTSSGRSNDLGIPFVPKEIKCVVNY